MSYHEQAPFDVYVSAVSHTIACVRVLRASGIKRICCRSSPLQAIAVKPLLYSPHVSGLLLAVSGRECMGGLWHVVGWGGDMENNFAVA